MQLLYDTALVGLRETRLPPVVRQVLEALSELVPAWRHSVGVIDTANGVFTVFESRGAGADSFAPGRSVPLAMFGGDLSLLRAGKADRVDDLRDDPGAAGTLRDSPMRSQLLVPIHHEGKLLGTINMGDTEVGRFTDDDEAVARQLAEIVSHVLTRVRLRQELLRAHDDALRASADRESYVAQVSHELRSPLNAVLGYLELLDEEDDEVSLGEVRDVLQRAGTSARMVRHLVDDVLELARSGSSAMNLQAEAIDLSALLAELSITAAPLVARNDNRWVVDCPDDVVPVADPLRLLQALLNLVSNAARFTSGGEVGIRARHVPVDADADPQAAPGVAAEAPNSQIVVEVWDTGDGIDASKLPTLFDPFTQAHRPRAGLGGTGLGLAITDRLVRRMGGRIAVRSEVGEGTCFTVTLPAAGPGQRPTATSRRTP